MSLGASRAGRPVGEEFVVSVRSHLDVRRDRDIGSRGRQGWLVSTTWPDEAGLPSSGSRVTVIVG